MDTRNLPDVTTEPRVADWQPLARWQKTGFWSPLKRVPLRRWPVFSLIVICAVALTFAFPGLIAAYPILIILALVDVARFGGRRNAGPGAESMIDLPRPAGQYVVGILLSHENVTYGEDQGILSVLEGGIQFSGQQTNFSLTRGNASLRPFKGIPHVFVVDFEVGDFKGYCGIIPSSSELLGDANFGGLYAELLAWDQSPQGLGWQDAIDPPITAQPELARRSLIPPLVVSIFCGGGILVTLDVAIWEILGGRAPSGVLEPACWCITVLLITLAVCRNLFRSARVLRRMGAGIGR